MRAVAIGVHQSTECQTRGPVKVRMSRVNARIVHFHQHVRAGQTQIIRCCLRIRRHAHRRAAQIIRVNALAERFDDLHAGQRGQRDPILRAAARATPGQTANCRAR